MYSMFSFLSSVSVTFSCIYNQHRMHFRMELVNSSIHNSMVHFVGLLGSFGTLVSLSI